MTVPELCVYTHNFFDRAAKDDALPGSLSLSRIPFPPG